LKKFSESIQTDGNKNLTTREPMKITKPLSITILSLIGLAIPVTGYCQIYTLSEPISGQITMNAQELNAPKGSPPHWFNYVFNNLSETVYIDPVAQTVRQVGLISGTPSAQTLSFQETQQTPGQFPNPITSIDGSMTVTLAPAGGGLTFDTGLQHVNWTAAGYAFSAPLGDLGNFLGSYSLVTGGQTYNGSFSYGITCPAIFSAFTLITTTDYPNSIALSSFGGSSYGDVSISPYNSIQADVIANNGFHMELVAGTGIAAGGRGEQLYWASVPDMVATLVVPEPASLSLVVFGLLGIIPLRRRQQ
jgi:hypothetical protein